jgi:hypothetical protein
MTLVGTKDKELKGGAGLKITVAASIINLATSFVELFRSFEKGSYH